MHTSPLTSKPLSDLHADLAEMPPVRHVLVRLPELRKFERLVDDGFRPSHLERGAALLELFPVADEHAADGCCGVEDGLGEV